MSIDVQVFKKTELPGMFFEHGKTFEVNGQEYEVLAAVEGSVVAMPTHRPYIGFEVDTAIEAVSDVSIGIPPVVKNKGGRPRKNI